MSKLTKMVLLALTSWLLMAVVVNGQGQSKCDTICANDNSCSTGRCILTHCSDSSACFKYCLNCAGVETCYASGQSCERAYNVVVLGSTSVKSSMGLVVFSLLLTFLLVHLFSFFSANTE